jgi:hypothetical protein
VHFWNRLPDGRELDLTRDQFQDGQVVGSPREVERPADVTRGRLPGHYHLLSVGFSVPYLMPAPPARPGR